MRLNTGKGAGRGRWLVGNAVILVFCLWAAPYQAQAGEAPEEAVPLALQVDEYQEDFAVSEQEAEEALLTQQRGDGILHQLEDVEGSDFAGAWFDHEEGEFVVPVVPAAEPSEIGEELDSAYLDGDYRFQAVESTWADLEAAHEILDESLAPLFQDYLIQTYVDAQRNAVVIRVSEDASLGQLEAIEDSASEAPADVEQEMVAPSRLEPGLSGCHIASRICGAPLRGGVGIGRKGPTGLVNLGCTAGFKAVGKTNGNRFVLTAGHCGKSGTQWWTEDPDSGFVPRVVGTMDQNAFPGGDWAKISANGTYWDQNPWPSRIAVWGDDVNRAITGESSSYLGQYVCKAGLSTGTSCGYVMSQDVTIEVAAFESEESGVLLRHMTEFGPTCGTNGDSGAPVFTGQTALGIISSNVFGGSQCGTYLFYSEITRITDDLGVSVAPRIGAPPVAETGDVTGYGFRSANIDAYADANGLPTIAYFQYGTTPALGSATTAWNVGSDWQTVPTSGAVGGLKGNTTYYYRLVAGNGLGSAVGETRQFTTPPWPPKVVTGTANGFMPRKAVLNATVDPQGADTVYRFEWGPTTAYGNVAPIPSAGVGSGAAPVPVGQEIDGLKGLTTYHFRVSATNEDGTSYGQNQPFTTPDWRPIVQTRHASAITEEEATLEGKVNPQLSPTVYQFEYGETPSYGTTVPAAPVSVGAGNSFVEIDERIGGLKPETLYYYRIKATNEEGTSYSDVYTFETFTTKATPATFSLSFGGHGTGNGQLEEPRGVTVDGAGDVLVADYGNDRVVEFDPDGQFIRAIGVEGAANEKLSNPVDVAIDRSTEVVWVAQNDPPRLVAFSSQGQFLGELAVPSNRPINSLTVAKGQRVIISQYTKGSLEHTTERFLYLTEYAPGQLPAEIYKVHEYFVEPQLGKIEGLTTNAAGDEVLVVHGTRLLKLHESGGKFAVTSYAVFGGYEEVGSAEGQVDGPGGITMRPSGNLLLADAGNDRIQQFSPSGEVIGAFRPEAAELEAATPWDIAVGPGGAEYVTLRHAAGNQVEKWLQPAAPEATTGEATELQAKQVTIKGIVNPVGRETTYQVEYGTAAPYSTTTAASAGISFTPQQTSVTLSGLKAETTYSYRVLATNKQGTATGAWKTFTTKPLPVTDMSSAVPLTPQIDAMTAGEMVLSRGNKFSAVSWGFTPKPQYKRGTVYGSAGWGGFGSVGYPYTAGAFWNQATFSSTGNGDAAVATLNATSTSSLIPGYEKYFGVWLNMPNPASAQTGYQLRFVQENPAQPNVYAVKLSKWTTGTETVLASKTAYTLPVGKRFALANKQGGIGVFVGEGGEFTQILSATDSTYTSGYVALDTTSNQFRILDFRGGALPAF